MDWRLLFVPIGVIALLAMSTNEDDIRWDRQKPS